MTSRPEYPFNRIFRWNCQIFHNFNLPAPTPNQPPATIFTISSRSPAFNCRRENSDGATASPLCSTTTLRGSSFCATRNSSTEHGNFASTGFPLAMIVFAFIFQHPTTNTEHPTSSDSRSGVYWMLGVECSMLDVSISCRQSRVPILPYRFVAELADQFRHFAGGTFVGDVELSRRVRRPVRLRCPFACA